MKVTRLVAKPHLHVQTKRAHASPKKNKLQLEWTPIELSDVYIRKKDTCEKFFQFLLAIDEKLSHFNFKGNLSHCKIIILYYLYIDYMLFFL
jgi:hypothetical protein